MLVLDMRNVQCGVTRRGTVEGRVEMEEQAKAEYAKEHESVSIRVVSR